MAVHPFPNVHCGKQRVYYVVQLIHYIFFFAPRNIESNPLGPVLPKAMFSGLGSLRRL